MATALLAVLSILPQRTAASNASDGFVLHMLSGAGDARALCLDGTRGGFYRRDGQGEAGASSWLLHFEGGGWPVAPRHAARVRPRSPRPRPAAPG